MSEENAQATDTTEVKADIKPWFEAIDQDARGYVENKGWLKKDSTPEQVLGETLKSYRELEKFRGANENELIKLPKEDGDWNDIYKKLGRPEAADKYELKAPEGTQLDPKMAEWFKSTAFEMGLNGKQAQGLFDKYEGFKISLVTDSQKQMENEFNQNMVELKKEWGHQYDERMELAKRAGKAQGLSEADIDLGVVALGPKFYNMLANYGDASGNDRRITGDSNANFGMSPAAAKQKIGEYTPTQILEISKNPNSKEARERAMLYDIAYGTQPLASGS